MPRVKLSLTKDEIDFLKKIGRNTLSPSAVVKVILEAVRRLCVNAKNKKSQDVVERIAGECIKQNLVDCLEGGPYVRKSQRNRNRCNG